MVVVEPQITAAGGEVLQHRGAVRMLTSHLKYIVRNRVLSTVHYKLF